MWACHSPCHSLKPSACRLWCPGAPTAEHNAQVYVGCAPRCNQVAALKGLQTPSRHATAHMCAHVLVRCRLVLARRHLMAYRVAEMLGGAGKEEVLLHWAAAKISASPSVSDGALKDALAAKVGLMDRPKYAPLAAHAQVRHAHWTHRSARTGSRDTYTTQTSCATGSSLSAVGWHRCFVLVTSCV